MPRSEGEDRKETPMYERFTDRARKVMQLANQECQRTNHETILPLHVLIALAREGCGVAANVLGQDRLASILADARNALPVSDLPEDEVIIGRMPLSDAAKLILEGAVSHSTNLAANYVGTEHILLSLFDDESTAEIIQATGVDKPAVAIIIRSMKKAKGIESNTAVIAKYARIINGVSIDIYAIAEAYGLTPALIHSLKKLLMAGQHGHKDRLTDLKEAISAIEREIEITGASK